MEEILQKINAEIREDLISEICYEGSNIIIYTKNEDFLKNSTEEIKSIVNKLKKRIMVRADPSILEDAEKTENIIREIIPPASEITEIYFEKEFSKVIIHAKRPGVIIGKNGEIIRKILEKTNWTPNIKRSGDIQSELIVAIRRMLHKEAENRKKFLHELGKKIYSQMKEVEWIRTTFLGGAREVGRSCILLRTPQTNVLLDCGISVSNQKEPYPYLNAPEFNIQDLDAIIISHAHLDHCGLVPLLYEKYNFRGPIYCTEPTRDLMALLQMDYIEVCQREGREVPYGIRGIEEMIKHSVSLDYGEVTDIAPDMRLTLENAGHMLGSSLIHLNIGNGLYNLLYTGDMKYGITRLFSPARTNFTRVEGVIIEATYGSASDVHPSRREAEKNLIESVKRAIERGGKVLVPSFAAERGQDVLVILCSIPKEELDIPIYLDGMLWDATAIHTAYPEFLSRDMENKILHQSENPFTDSRIRSIGSQQEREKVIAEAKPSVIISTSGMLNGGPILNYLEKMGEDERNMLIFVGYQGEGTLGRKVQKGWKIVEFGAKTIQLNLEVVTIEGLSGHSPQKELINFISHLKTKPKKIIVNHGENSKCVELAKTIRQIMKAEVGAPRNLETIRFK
ncbi:MAG: beta-CASP ribonuclease aCPSF1 [Candidatus Aenigmarchaeota archaeon]|nr:beta-CASP ribonuclease aCPSF1 [Candidatus Aenigmarchaeota archaeon]